MSERELMKEVHALGQMNLNSSNNLSPYYFIRSNRDISINIMSARVGPDGLGA